MVRITKTIQAKHSESLSPWIKEFRDSACSISLPLLPEHLATFPTRWPFPRGDLYHWISLLNRFDEVLESFCKAYKLDAGPQLVDFGREILETAGSRSALDTSNGHITANPPDGDRILVESILNFSRMLLQNCGNRSIYASSAHLNSLLNTTSLSLLESVLALGSELAQRYQAALKRMNIPVRHVSNALLANHYNIDLNRVLQMALPFSRALAASLDSPQPATPATPTMKGKERAIFSGPATAQKTTSTIIYANDLVSMVKDNAGIGSSECPGNVGGHSSLPVSEEPWADWGEVKITYYPKSSADTENSTGASRINATPSSPGLPTTPTPVRRSSNLGPQAQRTGRQAAPEELVASSRAATHLSEETAHPVYKSIDISSAELKSSTIHTLLRNNGPKLPPDRQYELLTKLRLAKAFTTSVETRRQVLAVRLLAITNLAFIHSETTFHEEVLKQDGDEPRRLQLVYQLAELVHPPAEGIVAVPRTLQTLAFSALDALSAHQVRFQDICSALNTTVNHGVLLYVVRKAVAEMSQEDVGDQNTEDDCWRDSLFSLLANLSTNPRTGGELVTAGLIPILVEVLSLHTTTAERYHPSILQFLDTMLYSARDAFQTLVNANGLDAVSDLIVYEVRTASEKAASGNGMLPAYRSASVDFEIPYFQQQTLKWLFKFIHHLMSTAGGYGGNFDRLLRNLIDSAQLLSSLREIIQNSRCFGSIVWTNAVSILNDFINNEPTSFAVIAEAGLSRGFLEAVTGTPIQMPPDTNHSAMQSPTSPSDRAQAIAEANSPSPGSDDTESEQSVYHVHQLTPEALEEPRHTPLARGIMPTSESINIVPQAFGAICLNSAGMKMFQASRALETFFEIFESHEHIKCMDNNKDLPASLGSTFDELIRHHPSLKSAIMNSILNMIARVNHLCALQGKKNKVGAKLWTMDAHGKMVVADEDLTASLVDRSVKGKGKAVEVNDDVDMMDAEASSSEPSAVSASAAASMTINGSMTPYVGAVATFLAAMFSNSSARSDFSAKGGIELVLDLASSPCLPYDFSDGVARRTLHQVIALLAESKPHLAIPSLLYRAQVAANDLQDFSTHESPGCFFEPFVKSQDGLLTDVKLIAQGTKYVKAFVNIHSLVATLNACFQSAIIYAHRSNTSNFTQINVADYYVSLVKSLGPLLGSCLKEDMQLQKVIPAHWKNGPRVKDSSADPTLDSLTTLEPAVLNLENSAVRAQGSPTIGDIATTNIDTIPADVNDHSKTLTKVEQDNPSFKNYQTLRFLLSKMSRTISPFFQTLGKALVPKRNIEAFQKSTHISIAESLAQTILDQLRNEDSGSSAEKYSYWIGILHVLNDMLIEGASRATERSIQTITLVLQAFKEKGGIDHLNHILCVFTTEIRSNALSISENPDKTTEDFINLELATAGAKAILTLYAQFVNGKNVSEASQTQMIAGSRSDRDRSRSDQLSAPQFLVELRMAVLPTVRELWESDLVEKGSSQISEKLIDLIRTICLADCESGALKRSDKVSHPSKSPRKLFKPNQDYQTSIQSNGFGADIATEALFRCNNNVTPALEYCREISRPGSRRHPIPIDILSPTNDVAPSSSRTQTSTSTGTATPDEHAAHESALFGIVEGLTDVATPSAELPTGAPDLDRLLSELDTRSQVHRDRSRNPSPVAEPPNTSSNLVSVDESDRRKVTIEDLNDERNAIRDNLIDRCLDVINAHGEVTFEVADLITAVIAKSLDAVNMRTSVSQTLVIALMSFAGEDDLRICGEKIAAYAHLLALMLRDKFFYIAALPNLKENLNTLLAFVKLSPNHSPEEPSPWIAHILLIVEMLLSEDSKPVKTKWTPPKDDTDTVEPLIFEVSDLSVPQDERIQLLEAILDILPRIGKDESLALAVLRILVILTRSRPLALIMGEKKNIQRLFVMAKQLAGASSTRIQSPLMLILRHIIEDDDTIKQLMKTEIKSFFEIHNQSRSVDEKHFLKSVAHTALRNPELFVHVASEMIKLSRWQYPSADNQPRNGTLMFKEQIPEIAVPIPNDAVQHTLQGTEDLTTEDVKSSTEVLDSDMPDAPKSAVAEQKLPVVENPDGVVHFLLCELMNYRDVEDKDSQNTVATTAEKSITNSTADIAMTGFASTTETPVQPRAVKTQAKLEFKAEDHPIYIYRCFILQCLTELLSSYNRTKIDFINFKRSAPPQAMTPSKPRSSVVNYLLFDLIPLGTLDHPESTALRKKLVTSSWADSVLTALLSKTGETSVEKNGMPFAIENEPDLLFVRRFVLENILKAYKDATSSTEPLDTKYSRLLALAELMNHIMNGKENVGMSDTLVASTSQRQLRRIMFEKGFVSALTASIADIDLNFPNAKRAIKYILRPLKTLTTTAVSLSDLALISTNAGTNDEGDIESATSISDPEEEREETPDLFRNSTLGMFEPGREEDSSSDSEHDDDEEMYEGEYGEEMDYGDDDPEDDEDNISDEDEDLEGMGQIEGLSGDHAVDVEVIMEDGDDDDEDEDEEGSSDDDDEQDSEDDDARVEIIEEVEEIQNLADEDMMGEWEESDGDGDDADEEDYEGQAADQEEDQMHALDIAGPLGNLVRALGGDEATADIIERMEAEGLGEGVDDDEEDDDEERMVGEYVEEGDEDDDEEDDEEMEDDDMLFDQYPPDGSGAVSFGWQDEVEPPVVVSRRSRGGGFSPFPFIGVGRHDPLGGRFNSLVEALAQFRSSHDLTGIDPTDIAAPQERNRTNPLAVPEYRSSYRSHRPGAPAQRSTDDGTNPLLQRNGAGSTSREVSARGPSMGSLIRAMGNTGADILDIGLGGGGPLGDREQFFNHLRSLPPLPAHITGNRQGLQFHITTGSGYEIPPDLQALFTMGRPARFDTRREVAEPGSAAFFTPQSTTARWLEEGKMIFGPSLQDRAADLSNALSALIIPPAIEVEKAIKAAEAERAQMLQEEAKKKAEEERIAKEAREAEEKLANEQAAEQRAAAERAAAAELLQVLAQPSDTEQMETAHADQNEPAPDVMEGVEVGTSASPEPVNESPAADRPRITTMIRGSPFDITDLDIDPSFLAELPEELREEVIMSSVAERRSRAAATGNQPSEIDQEFLAALPEDIRNEIVQQERQHQRRLDREERNREAAAANGGAAAAEMTAAEILATLPPRLRSQVLMEQDDETLALLPPELVDQARAALRDHSGHRRAPSGMTRRPMPPGEPQDVNAQRIQKPPAVQILDKSGVATLLRLMFIFQHGSLRSTLHTVLQNICLNRNNRAEVLSTLLHILQDGSVDMSAIDRSFAHLSLKAKQPKDAQPKTPASLKKISTGPILISSGTMEASPLMLVQQCLAALVYLTQVNLHTPAFFLTEHDNPNASRRSVVRKGKGKESKAAKYALNSLLSLLDRDLIMESSTVMEALSTLLNMITAPLQALQRKQKEAEDAQKSEATQADPASNVISATDDASAPLSATVSTNNDQTTGPSTDPSPPTDPSLVDGSSPQQDTGSGDVDHHAAPDGEPSVLSATEKDAGKDAEKKTRTISPPVIPDHNLQLVINIFVARECSSKTFRETLSTIKNLSAIPGAKAVFGRELISKAQGLGELILTDLEDLLPQIQKAATGTEIQGVALAKFSPVSSDQNKLLRVLTALDHLFDPKRDKPNEPDEGESAQLIEKQNLLSSLYDNPTFGRMWAKLSACLAVIRQREHMLNVATILLPLIEALMVVCGNTTLKDAPSTRSQGKDTTLTSPPPESRMETLFFTFTEEHRKILNDLVRHTPKLMSGSFSLLVKNPKVLEFDNKRNYFSRSIHSKAPNSRQSFPPLQLSVRRNQVFHDSFKSLYFQTGDQMKYGKLSIRFHGEEGVDAGGVTREWFQVLSRQMFDPDYALFSPVSSDRTTFHPSQLSSINEEHLMFFKFIGRIIGKALYEGRVLDCHFSRAVYKRILGKAVSVKDMESLDPDYYKSLVWMLENDITDVIIETFSVDNNKFGVTETIDFLPNGRTIAVTEENKHEYVRLMVEWRLTGSVKAQLDEFLKGFHDIIPADLVAIFNEQELELLISGLPEIDVDDWKSHTEYHNYSASSPQIQWFWRAVRSYDKEERAKLLQFVTGTSKVPLNGFRELEGMNGFSRFNIHRDYGNKDRLPSSHTCFNQLDLPEYESYEALRQQVLTAITAGSEYFGFA